MIWNKEKSMIGDKVKVIDPLAKRAGRQGLVMGENPRRLIVLFRDGTAYPYKRNEVRKP